MEKEFSHGLENLKKVVESNPQLKLPEVKPETFNTDDILILSIMHETVRNQEISEVIAQDYQTILRTAERTQAELKNEPPLCLYYSHNRIYTKMRPGLTVKGCVPVEGDVECIPIKKGKVLRFTYMGGYSNLEPMYDAIEMYLEEHKIRKRENYTWESYITDPGMEPDSAKWLTYIYVPVK